MINFYQKFLQGAAQVLALLMDALKGPGKSLSWSPVLDSGPLYLDSRFLWIRSF